MNITYSHSAITETPDSFQFQFPVNFAPLYVTHHTAKADAIANADKSNAYLENATAMKVAGTAASQLKKNEDAIKYLEKYLELSPNAKDAAQMKYTIAATAQVLGDKAKAREYYQQILSDPKFGPTAKQQLEALK